MSIKIANYMIFYNTLVCDAVLREPIMRGAPSGTQVKFPIRCAFCKLLKIRSYITCYFRFDPTTKYGRLCLFRDTNSKEFSAHEMCMLWSNRVIVDL